MSRHSAGFAPATRVASRKLGPGGRQALRLLDQLTRRLADQHVREHVRQVADGRHQPVVDVRGDRRRPRAERATVR